MDKYLCRKDVFDEIEKAMRDRSHLTQKKVTDKNGHQRTVWVKPGENSVAEKGKKIEETKKDNGKKIKTPLDVIEHVVEYGGDINDIKSQKLLNEAHDLSLRVANPTNDPNYDKKLTQFRQDCKKRISDIKNSKENSSKPKHSVGDKVTLDGAKGDFKVSSIDKDGVYHVVSADGKKGYKVSENHITGNKGNSEKKDYSTMSKDELLDAYNSTKDMDERDKIMAAYDKADKKESKTDLAGAEDKEMYDAYQQMADDEDKAFYESEKKEQKNSSNEKSTKKGYRKGDHVYDRYGERYTITGVDGDHVTAKKDGRSEEKSYSENSFEGIVAGSKNDFDGSNPDTDKALETYRNQINDIKKTNPSAYIEWVGQANKDYKKYKEFKEKADTVARAPMFATFPEYATAKHEAEKLEKKYPDFKELNDKHMAYYKFE